MDKSEIITLSSDEEGECTIRTQIKINVTTVSAKSGKKSNCTKSYEKKEKFKDVEIIDVFSEVEETTKFEIPEVVDLVECKDTILEQDSSNTENKSLIYGKKDNSEIKIVETNFTQKSKTSPCKSGSQSFSNQTLNSKVNLPLTCIDDGTDASVALNENKLQQNLILDNSDKTSVTISEWSDNVKVGNKMFDNFVNLCVTLEEIPKDKVRLAKKLHKHFSDANPDYIESEDFMCLLQKCIGKLNKNNIYLLAKEVTDELCMRKKIEIKKRLLNLNEQCNTGIQNEKELRKIVHKEKKKNKMINKILKYLDILGAKIRELEVAEVDLSDEEESPYVQLQRYRQKFCLIYKKLCEHTNEVSDANRMYSRKISFSGSKNPEINKCIENWLNKTKRFPDFSDILQLVERHSSSLGLISTREVIRATALEIFQKVGVMLQQRRKYDLWDSFCGFLDESEDPANDNPELENVFKQNFETRAKKEQEIITYYAQLQEKKLLDAVEVPDEEAYTSSVDSGNDDEDEILKIENSINEKVDKVIQEEQLLLHKKFNNPRWKSSEDDGNDRTSDNGTTDVDRDDEEFLLNKETKNNLKNCKSLKYREKKDSHVRDSGPNLKDLCKNEPKHCGNLSDGVEETKTGSTNNIFFNKESPKTAKYDTNIECTTNSKYGSSHKILGDMSYKTPIIEMKPSSPPLIGPHENINNELPTKKRIRPFTIRTYKSKKKCPAYHSVVLNKKDEGNGDSSFEVRYCQIQHNFKNFNKLHDFSDFMTKRGNGKRVFRDLVNINELLKPKRRKRDVCCLFTNFSYRRSKRIEALRKKRIIVNCRISGLKDQKCALDREEKTAKNIGYKAKDSKVGKDENNSGGEGNGEYNSFTGRGNGNEGDNNENDENNKNGKSKDEDEENKNEEDEDGDDENEDEKCNENKDLTRDFSEVSDYVDVKPIPNVDVEILNVKCDEDVKTMSRINVKRNKNYEYNRKRKNNLITAETTIGEEVVEAEVTLEENLSYEKTPKFNWSHKVDNNRSVGSSSHHLGNVDVTSQVRHKRKFSGQNSEPSDEERVMKFLLHSPSSISITPPKTMSLTKPPSQDVLKALATLKRLKGISTTRVRRTQSGESNATPVNQSHNRKKNSRRSKTAPKSSNTTNGTTNWSKEFFPVITRVQSINPPPPKIVTVEGGVTGFENVMSNSNTLKISNVWSGCTENTGSLPSCSQPSRRNTKNSPSKKNKKKKSVEYVELD